MGPLTSGGNMVNSSLEGQIWSRVTAEIPSPPETPLLWSIDAGATAAAAAEPATVRDCAWGDVAEALPHHALTTGRLVAGKHNGPWCAICQMPVSRCIEAGCHLRSPTPGGFRGPSRLGASSRASAYTPWAQTPVQDGLGHFEDTPGFGSSLGSRAMPSMHGRESGRWSTLSPANGDCYYDWQERPISPYAEELPSTMPTRLPPPTRSMVGSLVSATPWRSSRKKSWEERDLRSLRLCRSQMATPVVLRGDNELEEFDKAQRELNAEISTQIRKDRLNDLAAQQREWRRRSRRRAERKTANVVRRGTDPKVGKHHHHHGSTKSSATKQESAPEEEEEEEIYNSYQDNSEVPEVARWSNSRKTLRSFCMKRVQMSLRTNTANLNMHGSTGDDEDQGQASMSSRHKSLQEIEQQTHAMEVTRETNETKLAQEAFWRYDVDRSGVLELREIRAVLEDLGMMPRTPEEKAGLRRIFLETVIAYEQGNYNIIAPADESTAHDGNDRLDRMQEMEEEAAREQHRSAEEKIARRLTVSYKELPQLLERIRRRLKHCRQKMLQDAFNRRDIFERGELDLPSVKSILEDVDLGPSNDEEEARFKSLLRAMKVHGPSTDTVPKARRTRTRTTFGALDAPDPLPQRSASPQPSDTNSPSSLQRRGSKDAEGRRGGEDLRAQRGSKAPIGILTRSATLSQNDAPEENQVLEFFSENRTFLFAEFEIMVEFLSEAREQQRATDQRALAENLGLLGSGEDSKSWRSAKLFLEFRRELKHVYDLFLHFDEDNSGYLEINEIWEALITLGLMPKQHEDKVILMDMVTQACGNTHRADARCKRRYGGLGVALTWLYRQNTLFEQALSKEEATHREEHKGSGGKHYVISDAMRINFLDFLDLISRIRIWSHASMRDELRSLFERTLRKKCVVVSEVLCIPEVCKALEELAMAPTNQEEQKQIKQIFEDSNEWGFEPPTFDFETFVRLIRQVREWMHSRNRAKERDYASSHLGFEERKVNHYRMAFDILDEGTEHLDITGVRKVFRLLNRNVPSDQLRELFARMDLGGEGVIGFLEFLHLVYELDGEENQKVSNNAVEESLRQQDAREPENDLIYRHSESGQQQSRPVALEIQSSSY